MLKAVKLPAGIADLDTGLADVDGNALSHFEEMKLTHTRRGKKKRKREGGRRRRKGSKAFIKTPSDETSLFSL